MANLRYQTIEQRLQERTGMALDEWLLAQRAMEPKTSFAVMAHRLHAITGDYVSHETIRRWTDRAEAPKDEAKGSAA